MNHEIHDPVLISTANGFEFGVIEEIITSINKDGESTSVYVFRYGPQITSQFPEAAISELERPTAYDYSGMKKAIVAHPGYKWALEESMIRNAPPELRKNPPAPVSADTPDIAVLESPHA